MTVEILFTEFIVVFLPDLQTKHRLPCRAVRNLVIG